MVNSGLSAIPRALQRFDIANKISICFSGAQKLITVSLLSAGYSLQGIVVGNVLVSGIAIVVNMLIVNHILVGLSSPVFNLSTFYKLFRFGS